VCREALGGNSELIGAGDWCFCLLESQLQFEAGVVDAQRDLASGRGSKCQGWKDVLNRSLQL